MTDPTTRLRRGIAALERAYSRGHHGRWSAARRSDLVDEAVRELAAGLEGKVALVALGGYGRRELCPGSDLDLMVLHAERRADRIREMAERIFYPFWDAGFDLGHAVRTVPESMALADEDLEAATALLDARLVHGDRRLAQDLDAAIHRRLVRKPAAFLDRLAAEAAARHERASPCTSHLEPDLKEGAGGLRDVVATRWVVDVLGAPDGELLRAREAAALDAAHEFLIRLRSALHLETGRRTDRLLMAHQPALAEAFGYADEPGLTAPDALMRALFEHARQVEHVRALVHERAGSEGTGGVATPVAGPEQAVAAYAEAAEAARLPGPAALDAIEDAVPPEPQWTPPMLDSFLRVLAAPGCGLVLEAMDRGDLLARLIPEWGAVRCRPQRDPYHRFSVDRHLVRTLERVSASLRGEAGDDPLASEAVEAIEDRAAVLLGALFHDIGKRGDGSHVPVGARVVGPLFERMGVPQPTAETATFLVREHLLLSDTATRRDLGDENLILEVAGRVGTPERLGALYLVTAADAQATGPHAWTPWRQALIRELTAKAQHVLERETGPTDELALITGRMDRTAALLDGEDPDAVASYLARVPRGLVRAAEPEVLARHLRLLEPSPASAEVRTHVAPGTRPATYDLAVAAVDRPGLLAAIAGALALGGLNILSAQAFTTADGVALDLFAVEGTFEATVGEERWRRFRTHLRHALEGRVSLEHLVAEKRQHYPAPLGVPVEVEVDDGASDFSTVVEVSAADRIGLLFDLAVAFRDLGLDVHVAKVATMGERVVDAFYVRDLTGEKVGDRAEEIRRAIAARLA